jgi:hypothetical protein
MLICAKHGENALLSWQLIELASRTTELHQLRRHVEAVWKNVHLQPVEVHHFHKPDILSELKRLLSIMHL